MATQPKIIRTIVHQNSLLQQLSQRAQHLSALNSLLLKALPEEFKRHCYLANLVDTTLIIHVDNAAHASLMRFRVPDLIKTLPTKMNMAITNIEIKVRPNATQLKYDTNIDTGVKR